MTANLFTHKKKVLVSFFLISTSLLLGAYLFFIDIFKTSINPGAASCPNILFDSHKQPIDKSHQTTFQFKHLLFSSAFESGNLKEIRKLKKKHYSLRIGNDPKISNEEESKKNWFYFSTKSLSESNQKVKFSIHNLQYNWSMWKNGMLPVYKSSLKNNDTWTLYDQGEVKLFMKSKNIIMEFNYNFTANEEVYFAITFPYTYSQAQTYLDKIVTQYINDTEIYLRKETLIKSNQNRNVDMIILSSFKNITRFDIPKLRNLFPNRNQTNNNSSLKLFDKHKKVIIVSARVHPSESASSYMLEGFINSLIAKTPQNKRFLDEYVLVIIPVLNPDGVANGFTRCDINSINLNAHYKLADLNTPSIYALKKFIRYMNQRNGVHFYIDFHSHFTKRGFFVYGNPIRKTNYRGILHFPFLLKKLEPEFQLAGSSFGSDKSEESTSRKEIYKYTKLKKIYTVEANYWGGNEDFKVLKSKKLIHNNLRIVNDKQTFYKIEDFNRFGSKIASGLIQHSIIRKKASRNLRDNLNKEIDAYYKNFSIKKIRKKSKAEIEAKILAKPRTAGKFF